MKHDAAIILSPTIAKVRMAFYAFAIVDIAFVYLIYGVLQPYLYDLNLYIGNYLQPGINYILLIGILSVVFLAWFFALITILAKQFRRMEQRRPPLSVLVTSIIILVVWNGLYVAIDIAAGADAFIVFRFLEGICLYLFVGLECFMIALLVKITPPIVHHVRQFRIPSTRTRARAIISFSLILACYTISFSLPFLLPPPTITNGPLPPKPLLIGHRGAADYAPENTITAVNASLQFDLVGWEVDVQISHDGVFFLMHDDTLERTTNVKSVYPDLANQLACNFNFSQIASLDAGSWFVDNDPYGTIAAGIVSRSQADSYRGIKVPTLQDAITYSEAHGLIMDCDLKTPPKDHPYYSTAKSGMLAMLEASTLGKKSWVYTSSPLYANLTRMCTSNFTVANIHAKGYDMINTDVNIPNAQLHDLYQHGIPSVVYVVDNVEAFSTFWALGATYVKTDQPWLFSNLDKPIAFMDQEQYATLFLILYGAGAGAIAIFLLLKSRGKISIKGRKELVYKPE
ncbi:MAG TPA: glycerophosphodiester phosphodiesterase family protein [Candidatus Lokiarchaeia archaeon]|nr:glycerophosphodiester phosphodiesterase family protein [Candidatus Lokiarchaeia archaeon]